MLLSDLGADVVTTKRPLSRYSLSKPLTVFTSCKVADGNWASVIARIQISHHHPNKRRIHWSAPFAAAMAARAMSICALSIADMPVHPSGLSPAPADA
jgi:hypothetical protein